MSALTDFLHKLVDHVGASSLHEDIDAVEKAAQIVEIAVEDTTEKDGENAKK